MTPIDYLKLQSKNLYKDFKTQTSSFDPAIGRRIYNYNPKFFKIDLLIFDFNINEEKFKLGNAQHVIAKLCGLEKWTDLLKASASKIELSILLYTNMDRLEVRDWAQYVSDIETTNNVALDDEFRLQIFKEVFLKVEQEVYYDHYRLYPDEEPSIEDIEFNRPDEMENKTNLKITSLPLVGEERIEFINVANEVFEEVLERLEPENPDLVRKLWDAEKYIDESLLRQDMLPIDRDYALSLIEAFLFHYIIELDGETDDKSVDLI